jgi:serine/threonine protein kinase
LTDIKPNNILLDYEKTDNKFAVKNVQISDLEDAVILPPRKYLREGLCGNQMWRSPESRARSAQGTPSDIFSFGLVICKPDLSFYDSAVSLHSLVHLRNVE